MKHVIAVLFSVFLTVGQPAHAGLPELVCDDTMRLQDQLTSVVGAQRQGWGLRDPESMLEIWIVPETGDWTVVQNYANGTSCILAMGAYWRQDTPAPV